MLSNFVSLFLLSFFLSIFVVSSELVGPITINEFGESFTRYVVSVNSSGASTSSDGTSVSLIHDSNIQIAINESNNYTPYMFATYKLDGNTLSFEVDLSDISCSCNAAFYLTSMPALDNNGQPTGGQQGNYYCDANNVNGELCWEMDILESNMYAAQTTPHSCSQSPGQATYSCDGGGCGTNSYYENHKGLCPNTTCNINTMDPFRFSVSFNSSNIHVNITQGPSKVEYDVCGDSNYLNTFQQAEDYGMVIIMSYWGDDYGEMEWLDGMTGCTGDCQGTGVATFSNIIIEETNEETKKAMREFAAKKEEHICVTHEGRYGNKEWLSVPLRGIN